MKHSPVTFIVISMIVAATVSAGGHVALRVPDQWPDEAYRVDWEEAHIPQEVSASTRIAFPVTMRNTGDRPWPASQVFVSYHWLRDGRLVVWDGERTPLPRELRAGSRAAVSMRVATPHEPGAYVLMVTLVHEQVTWFEQKRASTIVRPVAVRPPTLSADLGCSGSTPCTAAR